MSNTSISGSSSPFSNYQRRRLPAKVVALSTANRDHSNGSVLLDTRSGTTTLQEMRDGYAEVVDPKSGVVGGVQDVYGEDTATEDQPVTPWAVSVASGYSLLSDPHHNKGLAFNEKERDSHYLCGLLPPTVVVSQELQVKKMMHNIHNYQVPLQRYMAMMDLQERNQRLFYKLLMDNVEELLPIVYTPAVGEACQKYGSILKRSQL